MKLHAVRILMTGLILVFLGSCRSTDKVQIRERNLADIYNPSRTSIHPDFSVNHINDNSSVIYMRIFPAELLFNQANEAGDFLAKVTIKYQLQNLSAGGEEVSDSATLRKTLDRSEIRNSYFSAIPVKAEYGNLYRAYVEIKDELRGSVSKNYLTIDKVSRNSGQNFRIISPTTGYPSFSHSFNSEELFRISVIQEGIDSLYVDYYSLDRTLPRPVFSNMPSIPMKNYPDTTWVVGYSQDAVYNLPETGIYMFKFSREAEEGLTLFNFGTDFPRIKSSDALLGPLVYLTSSNEFRDLRMAPNRKLAVDNYWLATSDNPDAARELIRVYYNRVLFANLYFSSYKEGWKTDRGMIYIIFGPPNLLEKKADSEKWIYFTRRGNNSLEFVFERKDNPFTYKDFQLDRRISSTNAWAEAVRTWNRGKIYSPEI